MSGFKVNSRTRRGATVLALMLPLAACSFVGTEDDSSGGDPTDAAGKPTEVVLVTHDSFALPKKLIKQFEADSGYTLKIRPSGDAGKLVTSLSLTAGNPTGDVAFGVDNAFASRALEEDVFAPYDATLPPGADRYSLDEGADRLFPVDTGGVCVNVDNTWFADEGLAPPKTLEDLTKSEYRDLLVLPGAETSSPGLAFLLATIAEYGDDWPDYWERLMANGAKLTSGWTDAYTVDFTAGGGKNGSRPIVVSYDSSPAFTIGDDGTSTTSALLDTCFQQVEYAGVLDGANNPEGAQAVVDFLLSTEVQDALPENMYVFPVSDDATLPEDWAKYAVPSTDPLSIDPAEVAANREDWLTTWSDITTR
jgi:thiamine transport system substrate-binding protein